MINYFSKDTNIELQCRNRILAVLDLVVFKEHKVVVDTLLLNRGIFAITSSARELTQRPYLSSCGWYSIFRLTSIGKKIGKQLREEFRGVLGVRVGRGASVVDIQALEHYSIYTDIESHKEGEIEQK